MFDCLSFSASGSSLMIFSFWPEHVGLNKNTNQNHLTVPPNLIVWKLFKNLPTTAILFVKGMRKSPKKEIPAEFQA